MSKNKELTQNIVLLEKKVKQLENEFAKSHQNNLFKIKRGTMPSSPDKSLRDVTLPKLMASSGN